MRFAFNKLKAAHAAAYLIYLSGGRKNYMALIKMLYLADRRALIEVGMPITGDAFVSTPHGIVLSGTLNNINRGRPESGSHWHEYISAPNEYKVSLINEEALNAGENIADVLDELSEYELDVLKDIHKRHGKRTQWQLEDLTHELPEYEDPHGSSIPIEPSDILRNAGKSDKEIERLTEEAEEMRFFARIKAQNR